MTTNAAHSTVPFALDALGTVLVLKSCFSQQTLHLLDPLALALDVKHTEMWSKIANSASMLSITLEPTRRMAFVQSCWQMWQTVIGELSVVGQRRALRDDHCISPETHEMTLQSCGTLSATLKCLKTVPSALTCSVMRQTCWLRESHLRANILILGRFALLKAVSVCGRATKVAFRALAVRMLQSRIDDGRINSGRLSRSGEQRCSENLRLSRQLALLDFSLIRDTITSLVLEILVVHTSFALVILHDAQVHAIEDYFR